MFVLVSEIFFISVCLPVEMWNILANL